MNRLFSFLILGLLILMVSPSTAASISKNTGLDPDIPQLENPMSVSYLKENLSKRTPRLILNAAIEKQVRKKLKRDKVVQNMYQALLLNAEEIMKKPVAERIKIGRRLLSVSREVLYRMNVLGMVYRIDRNPAHLDRINQEVLAVCGFSDWNPSHYLDVAEMAMAIAIAIDWVG